MQSSFITWKNDSTFQSVLKDATIIRWNLDGKDIEKKATKLPVTEATMISGSPNQQRVAIHNDPERVLLYVNLITDEVFKFPVDPRWTIAAMTWDNDSVTVHALVKENSTLVVAKATRDGTIDTVADIGAGDWKHDRFHALHVENHTFYLVMGTNIDSMRLVNDGDAINITIELPAECKALTSKGVLNVEWNALHHVLFHLEQGGIASVDIGAGIKEVLADRISYLRKFPRHTFQERAASLESMLALLP